MGSDLSKFFLKRRRPFLFSFLFFFDLEYIKDNAQNTPKIWWWCASNVTSKPFLLKKRLLSKPKYILNKQWRYRNLFSKLGYLHILWFSGKYSIKQFKLIQYFYNFQNVLYTFLLYLNWHSAHLFMSAAFAFSDIITFTIVAKDYSLHTLIILSKTQFQMWW